MKSKIQKSIFITFSIVAILFFCLLLFPLAFKTQILKIANKEINKSLNAEVGFDKVNINFIRSFPNASISLEDIYIAGKDDFKGDTLLLSKEVQFVINVKSLFSDTGYEIKKIKISDTRLFAHVLENGKANWDIVKSTSTEKEDTTSSTLSLKLEDFQIENSDILFLQDSSNLFTELKKINLALSGNLTTNTTDLQTELSIDTIRLSSENKQMLPQLNVLFKANIKTDLKKQRYELAENSIKINEIPLSLNGWVESKENSTYVDLKLKTGKVKFKSLLSLIPAIYTKSFDKIKSDGQITFDGYAKGEIKGNNYPTFALNLSVKDGWFQYPDLPKSVQSIQIQSNVSHQGGSLDNTVIDVSNFSLMMGENPLKASLHITTPISDPNVNLKANGKLDLGMIKEIYPLEKGMNLSGLFALNISGQGKMSYLDKNKMERLQFSGNANVKDLIVETNELPHSVNIDNANLLFSNHQLYLNKMNIKIGDNDISGEGRVENYLAYALRDKTLKGRFQISSIFMNLNDFISDRESIQEAKPKEEEKENSSTTSVLEIPKNLDIALIGNFKQLKYQKMTFENGYAKLTLLNGNMNIEKMNVDAFGGKMNLSGKYSSQDITNPFTNLNIGLNEISFGSIVKQVESLEKMLPFFLNATGKFNANFSLNTSLNQDMSPNLASIISEGQFNTKSVQIKDTEVLNQLIQALKLTNLTKFTNLKDIALAFKIKDGKLSTKPFTLKMGDYSMELGGFTGLDKTIDYKGKLKLPNKLQFGAFQNVGFKIGGTFTKPKVSLDVTETVTNIVKEQKEQVIEKIQNVKDNGLAKAEEEREKAIKEAKKRADKILKDAKQQGDKIIEAARVSGDSIIAKTSNPIAKEVAKRAAKELIKEAQKKADKIYQKAQEESKKEIENIEQKTQIKK